LPERRLLCAAEGLHDAACCADRVRGARRDDKPSGIKYACGDEPADVIRYLVEFRACAPFGQFSTNRFHAELWLFDSLLGLSDDILGRAIKCCHERIDIGTGTRIDLQIHLLNFFQECIVAHRVGKSLAK
jgi:hypothetical protein